MVIFITIIITPVLSMEFKIVTSKDFQTNDWSGGKTVELFIFPPESDYPGRDFMFRLSTSTVESDKSDFTWLPGISRKLLVLSGEVTLIHDGHYSRHLNKFDVDEFEGEWKTSSIGKCTDFNLMTKGRTKGEILAINIGTGKHFSLVTKENCNWFFIYLFSGIASIVFNSKITTITKGDLFILNEPATREFEITGIENCDLVLTEITSLAS